MVRRIGSLVVGSGMLILLASWGCANKPRTYEEPSGQGGEGGLNGHGGTGAAGSSAAGSHSASCEEDCGENASCELTDGIPACVCDEGYVLNGTSCEDIDECAGNDGVCDESATCENLPGSFSCVCPAEYHGDGTWCLPLTELISVAIEGGAANGASERPSVSKDGRFVAFASAASNLVQGDTNDFVDVFVRDTIERKTTRVSVSSSGSQGNGNSRGPSISVDGRYVVFHSAASNLVANDTNGVDDVFVHDLQMGTTMRVSVSPIGAQSNGMSHDAAMSPDGRFVAFRTVATNIAVMGQQPDTATQIVLKDLVSHATEAVSVTSDGDAFASWSDRPSLSADGRFVAFFHYGVSQMGQVAHRVAVVDRDQIPREVVHASIDLDGTIVHGVWPAVSANGRFVAFSSASDNLVINDTNGAEDVFVRDLQENVTVLASVNTLGVQGNGGSLFPSISADGQRVAFYSVATNLADDGNEAAEIIIRDLASMLTIHASVDSSGNAVSGSHNRPALSGDGRFVAFESSANFGYPEGTGTQIFLRALMDE